MPQKWELYGIYFAQEWYILQSASTQTDPKCTDINSLLDECNKPKVSELRLNEVVDDLRSKVQKRKSNLLLMWRLGSTLDYLPSLFSWHSSSMEAYIAVARQCVSDPDNSLKCKKKCLSPGEELFGVLMRMNAASRSHCFHLYSRPGSMYCSL